MKFKIITNKVLKECLANLLMKDYKKGYSDFRKLVKLDISEEKFEEFKKRKISDREMRELTSKSKINPEREVERIREIWDEKEGEIVKTMNEITEAGIDTKKITAYIDPYQNGGYYGEDNITIGTYKNPEDVLFVIAHELFHVFYWKTLERLNITKSVMGKEKPFEWEIAEGTVYLLTTDPRMRKFWKKIEIEVYPEIKGVIKKLAPFWRGNSFEDYLKKVYYCFDRER